MAQKTDLMDQLRQAQDAATMYQALKGTEASILGGIR